MRAIDIYMTGPVWEYRPQRYKTEHRNEDDSPDLDRIVFLGPLAQEFLKPYVTLNVTNYLFSPTRSEIERNASGREKRKSPMTPSRSRRRRKRHPKRSPGDHYDVDSYHPAIRRGCEEAGTPIWFFPLPQLA